MLCDSEGVALRSDPNHPAAADPCLLLAWLAAEDNAFKRFDCIKKFQYADFSSLSANQTQVELELHPKAFDRPVFRSPGLDMLCEWEDKRGWLLADATSKLLSIRFAADRPNIDLNTLRKSAELAITVTKQSPDLAMSIWPNEHEKPGWCSDRVDSIPIDMLSIVRGEPERAELVRDCASVFAGRLKDSDVPFPGLEPSQIAGSFAATRHTVGGNRSVHNVDELLATGENKASFHSVEYILGIASIIAARPAA